MEEIPFRSAASCAAQESKDESRKHQSHEETIDQQEDQQDADEDANLIHAKAEELGRLVDRPWKAAHVYPPKVKLAAFDPWKIAVTILASSPRITAATNEETAPIQRPAYSKPTKAKRPTIASPLATGPTRSRASGFSASVTCVSNCARASGAKRTISDNTPRRPVIIR